MHPSTSYANLCSLVASGATTANKGTIFENALIRWAFVAPEFNNSDRKVRAVTRWESYAKTQNRILDMGAPKLGTGDIGIDLVVELTDGTTIAMQAKGDATNSGHGGASKFVAALGIAAASGVTFDQKVFAALTGTSSVAATNLEVHGIRTLLGSQMAEFVDYTDNANTEERTLARERVSLRISHSLAKPFMSHQWDAIDSVVGAFNEGHSRVQLISACGTGKNITAFGIVMQTAAESTVFLAPSLLLVKQTINSFRKQFDGRVSIIALCSANDVTDAEKRGSYGDLTDAEFRAAVADADNNSWVFSRTQAKEMSEKFADLVSENETRLARGESVIPIVVFSTYASADAISAEQFAGRMPAFKLFFADEAHRTVRVPSGAAREKASTERNLAVIHDHIGTGIKAERRVYATATPKVIANSSRYDGLESTGGTVDLPSMNHSGGRPSTDFGPVVYEMWMGEAINRNLLSKYSISVLVSRDSSLVGGEVTDTNATFPFKHTHDGSTVYGTLGEHATILAIQKAFKDGDRSFVVYHNSIADSKRFADMVTQVTGIPAEHIDGTMSVGDRDKIIGRLDDGQVSKRGFIVSNDNVLSEGVDIPTLDAVVFAASVGSMGVAIQRIGRALRKAEGKTHGRIICPVVLAEKAFEFGDGASFDASNAYMLEEIGKQNGRFKTIATVLAAMAEHDRDMWNELTKTLETKEPVLLTGDTECPTIFTTDSGEIIVTEIEPDDFGGAVLVEGTERERLAFAQHLRKQLAVVTVKQELGKDTSFIGWLQKIERLAAPYTEVTTDPIRYKSRYEEFTRMSGLRP